MKADDDMKLSELEEGRSVLPAVRDDEGDLTPRFIEAMHEAVFIRDQAMVEWLAEGLHAADMGALLSALGEDNAVALIELLGPAFDFEALTEIEDTTRVRILDRLPTTIVVEGMRELDSDDAVYILEDLNDDDQAEILEQLPAPDRALLERSLDYPDASAGRRMKSEFLAVPPFWTVEKTISHCRQASDLPDNFYEIFVIDPGFHLLGQVSTDKLLRSGPKTTLEKIMQDSLHKVEASDDLEDVARAFERYNLVSTAVVDEDNRLVGILTADDIVDVIQEEAEEDLKALAGVNADEELSDSILYITKSRFTWLFINLITAILASAVIDQFQTEIAKMAVLAVLMPIVASQGGNAATQTMTIAVRALATQMLGTHNGKKFVAKELAVGIINGGVFALMMAGVAALWFQSPELGMVIAFAMLVNLVAASLAGALIPIALERAGFDPAVASAPFVTTVTDVVGFFAFLGFATWWFSLI
jgi:magnesium transporter